MDDTGGGRMTDYAVKAVLGGAVPEVLVLERQKTMYGGKAVAAGDRVFVFDRAVGLVAWGLVEAAEALPREEGVPRVSVTLRRQGQVVRPFGRAEVKGFCDWDDGRPETEVNFKFYRQATDKVVGITAGTGEFLAGFF